MAEPDEKREKLKELLEGGVVMLHIDARRPGVRVPPALKAQMQLRLNFNHEHGKDDLVMSSWGVRETLRFQAVWYPVSIPWSAVYALSADGADPVVFAEDLPEELIQTAMARLQLEGHSLEELEENRPRPLWPSREKSGPAEPEPTKRPRPRPVRASRSKSAEPEPEPPSGTAPRRGHLRLVK